jgi:tRNA threonylcarbamoyl adenosine modification protein YeaZ
MDFLVIDSSTDIISLFIKVKNKTFNKVLQSHKLNSDLLMKHILDFFKINNLELSLISKIFVNQGPGNFSGLRGSLAVAKGISLAKKIDLFGYNTFLLSAAKFYNKKNFIFSLIKCKEKYFIKKFDGNLNSLSSFEIVSEEAIVKKYKNNLIVSSKNGIEKYNKKILKLNNFNIVNLDPNMLEFLELKGLLDKDLIKPLNLS